MQQAIHRFLMLALPAVLFTATAVAAGESEAPTLVTNSPFLPPDFSPPGGAGGDPAMPASVSQYEFHGVYQMDGQYYFNLYNTRDKSGTWVTESESGGETPKIVRYDIDEDVLVVELAGERMNLQLVETSDRTMPVATAPRTTPSTRPSAASGPATTPGSPTPVRRRVIRPAARTTPPTAARRPTVPPSNSQQQQP